jgi:hypothetical protein
MKVRLWSSKFLPDAFIFIYLFETLFNSEHAFIVPYWHSFVGRAGTGKTTVGAFIQNAH